MRKKYDCVFRVSRRLTIPQRPLVYSDILEYRQPRLQNTPSRDFWDNLSADVSHNASHSSSNCGAACETSRTCLQYSYTANRCQLSPYILLGHQVTSEDVEFISGWNLERITQVVVNSSDCEISRWTQPVVHRCGLINCA